MEKAAKKACLTGKPDKGVEILADLYIENSDATYIFNQGRCFEQNNRYEEAIGRFREYLRKAKEARPEDRADAEKHIAECRALLGEKKADELDRAQAASAQAPLATSSVAPGAAPYPPPSPTATQPVSPALSPQLAPAQSPAVLAVQPAPLPAQIPTGFVLEPAPSPALPQDFHPGRGLSIAGMTCGALGLGSVGAGIYFYTQARSYSDKVSKQRPPDPADQDSGKWAETMQWVFYSVGGAAIATGTVLYVFGMRTRSASPAVASILPVFGPSFAGLSAQGAF